MFKIIILYPVAALATITQSMEIEYQTLSDTAPGMRHD